MGVTCRRGVVGRIFGRYREGRRLHGGGLRESRGLAGRRGADFDFYVLALSWSPGSAKVSRARATCGRERDLALSFTGSGRNMKAASERMSGRAVPIARRARKSGGLVSRRAAGAYEWRKHGVRQRQKPERLFRQMWRAPMRPWRSRRFSIKPTRDQTITPIDVERAFYEANPRRGPA